MTSSGAALSELFELQMFGAGIEKRYRAQFVALDAMLNKMNSTSTYLTQQLSQIASLSSQ